MRSKNDFVAVALMFLGLLALVAVLSLLLAWPFMWIWNYAVVSAVTIAKPISYWVAFWLACFLGIYFRSSSSSSS